MFTCLMAPLNLQVAKDNLNIFASGAPTNTNISVAAAAGQSAQLNLGYNAISSYATIYPSAANALSFLLNTRVVATLYSSPIGAPGQAFAVGANDNSAVGIFAVGTSNAGVTGLVARGRALQTASLFEAQDENSVAHVYISAGHSTKPASLVVGKAVLANAATDGFLYVPTVAGTPTGVPTARIGTTATVYDTTANKLWIYNGAWRGVVLA